jgi:hypothetical protein
MLFEHAIADRQDAVPRGADFSHIETRAPGCAKHRDGSHGALASIVEAKEPRSLEGAECSGSRR